MAQPHGVFAIDHGQRLAQRAIEFHRIGRERIVHHDADGAALETRGQGNAGPGCMPAIGIGQDAAGGVHIGPGHVGLVRGGLVRGGKGNGADTEKECGQDAKRAGQGGTLQSERDRGAPIVMESAWHVRAHMAVGSVFDGGKGMVPPFVEEVCPALGIFPLRQPRAAFPGQQLRAWIDRLEHDPVHDSSSAITSMLWAMGIKVAASTHYTAKGENEVRAALYLT